MNETKTDRMPSGTAARRIRDYELPFVPWEARAEHGALRTHRGVGSAVDCASEGFAAVGVV